MNISSFKLLSGGNVGIVVNAVESILQSTPTGVITILDKVGRTRPYPIPDFIREKIQALKYFYLNLTGHWIEPFNKYFSLLDYKIMEQPEEPVPPKGYFILQNIMNHSEITGVTVKDYGFVITGTIETVEGKKIGVVTPYVTEEDDVSFHSEAMTRISDIMNDIANLLRSTKAIEFNADTAAKAIGIKSESTEGMSKQQIVDLVIAGLEQRGAVILEQQNFPDNIEGEQKDSKTTLHTGNGSIDSHNMPEATDVTKDEKENEKKSSSKSNTKTPDKKSIGKGTLVSDKKFPMTDPNEVKYPEPNDIPDGGTLEIYEHSENLGMNREEPLLEDASEENEKEIKTEW